MDVLHGREMLNLEGIFFCSDHLRTVEFGLQFVGFELGYSFELGYC